MIELVIVVLILGITAAVAVPRYVDSISDYRVEAAAERIAADLGFARRMAVATGSEQRVHFHTNNVTDPNDEKYELMEQDHPDHSYSHKL